MRFVITNDGDSNNISNAIFGVTDEYLDVYSYIGMSYAVIDGCKMSQDPV
jgi:hypothetical protein